jgi:DNA primase catalytic core
MSTTYNLKTTTSQNLGSVAAALKDRVVIEDVANHLGLIPKFRFQKNGNSLQGECPTGHSSQGGNCISIDVEANLYNCFHCGEAGDVIRLVQLDQRIGFVEAVKWLVQTFAPDLDAVLTEIESSRSDDDRAYDMRGKLYSAVYYNGKKQMDPCPDQAVIDYLVKDRGYDLKKVLESEFIFWDTEANIRTFLHQQFPVLTEEIDKLSLQGNGGDNFRLAIPYRDRNGIITGFLKRAHVPAGFTVNGKTGVRWDSTSRLSKKDIFGLNRIRKTDTLIIVEGYPDATILPTLGLDNIVALGQGKFSESYFDGLRAKHIKRVIFALDNDGGTGIGNTESACNLFADSEIQAFVIDPSLMGTCKDPDEYVKANGVDAFKALVPKAESASKWMVERILATKNIAVDLERYQAIDEVLDYAVKLRNPLDVKDMLDALIAALALTPELLEQRFEQFKEKQAEAEFQDGVRELTRAIDRLVREGKGKDASAELASKTQKLITRYNRSAVDEEVPLAEFLRIKQQTDSLRLPGSKLGYTLSAFPLLDAKFSGIQTGLYIVAADPNIGKTIFLVNLSADLINSNKDLSVLFFTMDDSREAIINRFLAKLSGLEINDVQCKQSGAVQQGLLDKAYAAMFDWTRRGLLEIRELTESMTMESLTAEVREHPHRDKLVVVIDGMYNVPLQGNHDNIREQNIARATLVKEIVKLYKLPVIATAEVRKRDFKDDGKKGRSLHDIMESGKYGYNADAVLLLHPQSPTKYRQEPSPIINFEFGKNKLAGFRDIITMEFTKATASFKETGEADAEPEANE